MADDEVTDAAVKSLIGAINTGDEAAFYAALAPDATMSDDGTERDLKEWAAREIFASNGRMNVVSAEDEGRSLVAEYRNDTWGSMTTRWRFTVQGGKVARFETGQA